MTYAPRTLTDLMALWTSNDGTNSGIVGDAAHASRSSYHNGFDVASKLAGTTNLLTLGKRDYSFSLPRDRVNSNAAAAVDLGKLRSLPNLQKFSVWLVAQARANPAKYRDVREIIYSPDGKVVKRWSGPDNKVYAVPLTNAVARGHLWHTHISFYRDSEARDKRPLFADYFAPPVTPPDTSTGDDMLPLAEYAPGATIVVKPTANVRDGPKLNAKVLRAVKTAETWAIVGSVKGDKDPDGGSDVWYLRWAAGHWEFTAKSNVTSGPSIPVADCTAAVTAAIAQDRLKAKVVYG